MFVGHYGVAFGAKPAAPFLPLWVYFLAVQWLDVVWSILVLLGIEKLHIVPGITEANPYDLYYMPYTHSLPGALALSLLFGAIVAMLSAERRALAFLVIVLAAFSHWVLDLLVHIPDFDCRARLTSSRSTAWCARWIPSKLPTLTIVGPKSAGTSSRCRKTCIGIRFQIPVSCRHARVAHFPAEWRSSLHAPDRVKYA